MKRITILLLVICFKAGIAQNVLIIKDASCLPDDTVTLTMDITNTDKFISFQFDLGLPDDVSFLGYSIAMTTRSMNHVAIGNMVGTKLLRIFSYSPNNAAFSGNSGAIITLKLVTGKIRGAFPLVLSNAIIGDSLSKNIITGTENGTLSVFPMDVVNLPEKNSFSFKVYPNPCKDQLMIETSLPDNSALTMEITTTDGKSLGSYGLGIFEAGIIRMKFPETLLAGLLQNQVYIICLKALGKDGSLIKSSEKFIKK